jgi:hypothetical protein
MLSPCARAVWCGAFANGDHMMVDLVPEFMELFLSVNSVSLHTDVLDGIVWNPAADGLHLAKLACDVQVQGVVPSHNVPLLFLNASSRGM